MKALTCLTISIGNVATTLDQFVNIYNEFK